ncbi:pilus assembly PilX family protein [Marinobacter halophilus]|uniref:MSHA biogenesis protein MshP n=1 Tax=Marinobacter halophilus TaxID=1323740 RepID=A0A2T1KG29_9GAMM|nr:hypothetical protein [Marinobacter halophilus]PSF09084.1 hypothetical protein C7H08_05675 [Marinobacter halophilus]GGC83550.1 hypothetical protein GCM10011362_34940 [Marinobacter halophilus]
MYPEPMHHRQTGAGLPVALFIITVLALLVIGMAQLQESSSKAVSLQIQSQRAFFAAESGAQVALSALLLQGENIPLSCGIDISGTKSFASKGLAGCFAAISCSEFGSAQSSLVIQSQGVCGVGADRAERMIEVRLR